MFWVMCFRSRKNLTLKFTGWVLQFWRPEQKCLRESNLDFLCWVACGIWLIFVQRCTGCKLWSIGSVCVFCTFYHHAMYSVHLRLGLCWAAACQRLIYWDEICAGIQPGPLANSGSFFLEAPAHASCLDAGLGGWMLQPPKAAPILGMF